MNYVTQWTTLQLPQDSFCVFFVFVFFLFFLGFCFSFNFGFDLGMRLQGKRADLKR